MTEVIHCIYASAAAPNLTDSALATLLERAREDNRRLGLTGMLLFYQGSFLQVLEGPPEVVDALYENIARDERHVGITKIIRESIARRHFEDWTMGFTTLTQQELASLTNSNDFFEGGRSLVAIDAGRAKKLVTAFQKGRWRIRLSGARQIA